MNRREVTTLLTASTFAAFMGRPAMAAPGSNVIKIGYQKSSTLIGVLKAQGSVDRALAPLGLTESWAEFPNGLPLLEALNVGAIDFSADVADTVPLFAQAAGANLTYVARETPSPAAQAILVPEASPIKRLADLKGKKVAVTKGAGSHYLLLASLRKVGLTSKDVEAAYLAPADGRAAFEKGAVAAWVTWDPFVAAIEAQSKVRRLTEAEGVANYQRYYLASASFAKDRKEALSVIVDLLRTTGAWVKKNPDEAAKVIAPIWGLPESVVAAANSRRSYDVRFVTQADLGEQQTIADVFFAEGLLPRAVRAADAAIFKVG